MWHIIYWWKKVLSASKENKIITKEDVIWPGSVKLARDEIGKCHREWINNVKLARDEIGKCHREWINKVLMMNR